MLPLFLVYRLQDQFSPAFRPLHSPQEPPALSHNKSQVADLRQIPLRHSHLILQPLSADPSRRAHFPSYHRVSPLHINQIFHRPVAFLSRYPLFGYRFSTVCGYFRSLPASVRLPASLPRMQDIPARLRTPPGKHPGYSARKVDKGQAEDVPSCRFPLRLS